MLKNDRHSRIDNREYFPKGWQKVFELSTCLRPYLSIVSAIKTIRDFRPSYQKGRIICSRRGQNSGHRKLKISISVHNVFKEGTKKDRINRIDLFVFGPKLLSKGFEYQTLWKTKLSFFPSFNKADRNYEKNRKWNRQSANIKWA